MVEDQLLDRRSLVQFNATIIAGMLIFVTVAELTSLDLTSLMTKFCIIVGFFSFILSSTFCMYPERNKIVLTCLKLDKDMKLAESLSIFGLFLLFLAFIPLMI